MLRSFTWYILSYYTIPSFFRLICGPRSSFHDGLQRLQCIGFGCDSRYSCGFLNLICGMLFQIVPVERRLWLESRDYSGLFLFAYWTRGPKCEIQVWGFWVCLFVRLEMEQILGNVYQIVRFWVRWSRQGVTLLSYWHVRVRNARSNILIRWLL